MIWNGSKCYKYKTVSPFRLLNFNVLPSAIEKWETKRNNTRTNSEPKNANKNQRQQKQKGEERLEFSVLCKTILFYLLMSIFFHSYCDAILRYWLVQSLSLILYRNIDIELWYCRTFFNFKTWIEINFAQ